MKENKNELVFEDRKEMRKYFEQFPVEKRYEIAEKNKIIISCKNNYEWILTKNREA